jgi:hypothetical protein
MKQKRLYKDTHGVAGVIEALLMVALVAIIISIIQLQYIPQIMEQREADHMDQISNQFSTLKSMMDLQAITNSTTPIFSMVTLGSRELPYFVTIGSYGDISVQGRRDSYMNIDYNYKNYSLTSIKYAAENFYFIDQTYILEGGGMIVSQSSGEPVMRVDPSIQVVNRTNDLDIYWNHPIFIGIPGRNMTSGNGKCFVRTNWSRGAEDIIADASSIYIRTQYPHAWNESLHGLFANNVNFNIGSNHVEITRKTKDINLYVTYYYIYTQIGIGWIK